ncbi:MAG: hypothetical protein ACFE9D_04525 [Promethearchaeota archaeon]
MVHKKAPSWVKHAVRRWKQFYNDIQFADGQIDTANPLSVIFRNETLMTRPVSQSQAGTTPPIEPTFSKKEESTRSQPEKAPPPNPQQKQRKGRFISKLKDLQYLIYLTFLSWDSF